jgi:hypothetical protein
MGRACSMHEGKRNIYDFGGKARRKETILVRARRRWVDTIIMYLREIRRCGIDWIDLAQVRDQWRALVNSAMNFRVL